MKKIFAVICTSLIIGVVGNIVQISFEITFPSFIAQVIYVFVMIFGGGVLWTILGSDL